VVVIRVNVAMRGDTLWSTIDITARGGRGLAMEWPGWPAVLTNLIRDESGVKFRSCSWQRLLASGAVPTDVVEWARDKHGLVGSQSI
jgi:hypothetical protein